MKRLNVTNCRLQRTGSREVEESVSSMGAPMPLTGQGMQRLYAASCLLSCSDGPCGPSPWVRWSGKVKCLQEPSATAGRGRTQPLRSQNRNQPRKQSPFRLLLLRKTVRFRGYTRDFFSLSAPAIDIELIEQAKAGDSKGAIHSGVPLPPRQGHRAGLMRKRPSGGSEVGGPGGDVDAQNNPMYFTTAEGAFLFRATPMPTSGRTLRQRPRTVTCRSNSPRIAMNRPRDWGCSNASECKRERQSGPTPIPLRAAQS